MRANENIALTATHTLFAREHNRIVDALPAALPEEQKFQIARRVVGAEQQYITYNEFLPALGVGSPAYRGYNRERRRDARERVRGRRLPRAQHDPRRVRADGARRARYTAAQLDAFEAAGHRGRGTTATRSTLVIPLNVAFGNPDLLPAVGARPGAAGPRRRAAVPQRRADRQPAAQRAVPGARSRATRGLPRRPAAARLLHGRRGPRRDRRRARPRPRHAALQRRCGGRTGCAPKTSFTAITGESTDRFPNDPRSTGNPIDDPNILDFVELRDDDGNAIALGSRGGRGRRGRRRPPHDARGAAEGDLRQTSTRSTRSSAWSPSSTSPASSSASCSCAIWKRQFEALRDGDRFFYPNDPALPEIERLFGITTGARWPRSSRRTHGHRRAGQRVRGRQGR